MSDLEKQKLSMYESVISFLVENRDIVAGIRPFSLSVSRLRKTIDEIRQKEKQLSSDTLEKTIVAYKAKDELIITLIPVVSALYNFARDSKNIALKEKARFAQSYYIRLRDGELIDKAYGILALAQSNLPKLRKFNISASSLGILKNKIDTFKNAIEKKVVSFISSDAVMSITSLFNEADKILLNQLDPTIEQMPELSDEFYDEYLSIRSMEDQDGLSEEMLELEEEE